MKNLLLLFILISPFYLSAQKKQKEEERVEIPVFIYNDSGFVSYTDSIYLDSSASNIFIRLDGWFNDFYPNPTGVLQERNAEEKVIRGHARFRIKLLDEKTNVMAPKAMIEYNIELKADEDRKTAIYTINSINPRENSYVGLEKWIKDNEELYTKERSLELVEVDKYFQDLIYDLKRWLGKSF